MAAIFVPSCTSSGSFHEVQCQGGQCWCVDPQGREVTGTRTFNRRPRCPTRCETERTMALKVKSNMAASAELHIPACSEDGSFLPLQCVGSRCFCVDAGGKATASGPTEGAATCKTSGVLLTCIFMIDDEVIPVKGPSVKVSVVQMSMRRDMSAERDKPKCDAVTG